MSIFFKTETVTPPECPKPGPNRIYMYWIYSLYEAAERELCVARSQEEANANAETMQECLSDGCQDDTVACSKPRELSTADIIEMLADPACADKVDEIYRLLEKCDYEGIPSKEERLGSGPVGLG